MGEKTVADILVADDSLDDLRLIVEILSREGYNVRPAIDGEAALAGIRAEPPDLLILDIKMPKINGFEVCRHLKTERSPLAVPVVFVSASENVEDKVRAFSAGAVDYITKPYQAEEVVARVKMHLSFNFLKKETEGSNVLLAREISERHRVEDELIQSHKQLRRLSTHLHSFIEEERARMAREIHDDLGQALTIFRMDLAWLARKLSGKQQMVLDKIESMSASTLNTLQSVKMICADLRPGILDDFGLAAAIEWQAGEFKNRTGIKAKVTSDPEDIILDEKRSTALFRIFQETLTNVLKHANATRVEIDLKKVKSRVELTVKDNGIGINQKQITRGGSLGLLGIRERIHTFGGKTEITGVPGAGTTISVSVPLEKL